MKRNESKFRVVRRTEIPRWKAVLIYSGAVILALVIGALLLISINVSPLAYYKQMFTIGMLGNKFAYKSVEGLVKVSVPLMLTALALSVSFRIRFWNIGGEGQFTLGAIAASFVALAAGDLPMWLLIPLMCLAGMAAGALYGLLPAVLKVKFGTNETLLTLMLNYIALYLLGFFGETNAAWNIFLDPSSARPRFLTFAENAWMPGIKIGSFTLNISLVVTLVLYALALVYLGRTKHGYEISVVGDSPSAARYAGMPVGRIVIRTMLLSAGMIGLAGSFYVSTSHVLSTSVTNNVGWTGVIVAWLAKLHPVGIFVTSILISVLRFGCQAASTSFATIDSNFADLLQGIILFAVLAADFMIRFRIVIRRRDKEVQA